MSIKEKVREAEAVLDSAEMMLETYPGAGGKKRELKRLTTQLEKEIQDPESEDSLNALIKEIKEFMDEMKDEPMDEIDDPVDEPMLGPDGDMGGPGTGMEDDVPPF